METDTPALPEQAQPRAIGPRCLKGIDTLNCSVPKFQVVRYRAAPMG